MIAFFRCVAEAVVENGFRGLADMVPGGPFALNVATAAWKKYRERKKEAEAREEIQQLAQSNFEQARNAAIEAVKATAPPTATVEERLNLELYLSQVPGTVRASLKRPADTSGKTVPSTFVLSSPEELAKLLPARPPRFKPNDPVPGLAGWSLVELLGVGGFGEVWLARHRSMSSLCGAVKFCHGKQGNDLKHESDLIDRVMSAGRHKNIVPLTNVSLEGESPWLMYEYVQGGDLSDLLRSWQKVDREKRVQQTVLALRQISTAVAHFHRASPAIVHRDLKPANILLDRVNSQLRITDFGIGAVAAKAALSEELRSGTSSVGRLMTSMRGAHTPLYASPQQREGQDPDPRDDVHALGVIGYQLITGHLNQGTGPDFADDLREHGASEALIALLGRCVASKPDRRPKDAAELAEALSRLGSGPAVTSPAPPPVVGSPLAVTSPVPPPVVAPASVAAVSPAKTEEPERHVVGAGGPLLTPNGLAILKGLQKRGATSKSKAVSKYLLMEEDGVGPHADHLASDTEEDPECQGLIVWENASEIGVETEYRSPWVMWITPAGIRAIDNHVLLNVDDGGKPVLGKKKKKYEEEEDEVGEDDLPLGLLAPVAEAVENDTRWLVVHKNHKVVNAVPVAWLNWLPSIGTMYDDERIWIVLKFWLDNNTLKWFVELQGVSNSEFRAKIGEALIGRVTECGFIPSRIRKVKGDFTSITKMEPVLEWEVGEQPDLDELRDAVKWKLNKMFPKFEKLANVLKPLVEE